MAGLTCPLNHFFNITPSTFPSNAVPVFKKHKFKAQLGCPLQSVAPGYEHLKCASFVQLHTANTESNFQFTALKMNYVWQLVDF